MKVLVVPKWYPWPEAPALGLFCREHARALAGAHDVVVLASRATPGPDFAGWRIEEATEDRLRTIRVRYRRPLRARPAAMGFQTAGMLAVLRHLRAEGWRPDVVHAHVYQAAPPALLLGRLSGAPVAITEHYTGFVRGLVTGYDRVLARASFERAAIVAPVSRDLERHLRAIAPGARFEVVPNVVDTEVFSPGPPTNGTRLLNVAALAEKKGHRFLLEALAGLPGATLDLVGDGELRAGLERRARELGVSDRVTFLGEQPKERVAELMRAADLFVLPSLSENLPVVLIEAQASGLPAVATSVNGVPELVDAEAGILVAPGDPAALATGIRTVLAERDRFDRSALARRAGERYGYAAVRDRWTAIYDRLLS